MSRYISINLLVFTIIFISLSCNSSSKKSVINMSDITPHSERDRTYSTKEKIDTIDFGFNSAVANELGLNLSGLDFIEEPMFPDRFSAKRTKKLSLRQEIDSTLFCQWSFKDSTQTKNAFYNWIDCFGEKNKSIHFGQNVNFQKDNFIILVNDTSLTYITSENKIQLEDWLLFFEKSQKIKNWKTLIYQGTRGKATWYSVIEGKKEPLKPTK
jgi:hypothetical protein